VRIAVTLGSSRFLIALRYEGEPLPCPNCQGRGQVMGGKLKIVRTENGAALDYTRETAALGPCGKCLGDCVVPDTKENRALLAQIGWKEEK